MGVVNTGDSEVFFDVATQASSTDDLISSQVDPSQPQIQGLTSVTSPLVPDRHVSSRLSNFDPKLFDLSDDSHLMRLLTAFLGAGGVGGLRRQMTLARMSGVLAGTNWLELDGFWGKIFSLPRDPFSESLPLNPNGTQFDAQSTVADSEIWDQITSRDGRYRSRIEQLAKGFASGGTYNGMYLAATAILNCDVELVESWNLADSVVGVALPHLNSYFVVEQQYGTYGVMRGHSWAELSGVPASTGDTPSGNRGDIVVVPGRSISEAERWTLTHVLGQLAPAGTVVSVAKESFAAQSTVEARSVEADSNDWQIISLVSQQQAIDAGALDLYPATTEVESARPGFANYTGEKWAYNGRVASVSSYAMRADGTIADELDYDTITFTDGSSHDYVPMDAMAEAKRTTMARAAADGVMTTFPYVEGRRSA